MERTGIINHTIHNFEGYRVEAEIEYIVTTDKEDGVQVSFLANGIPDVVFQKTPRKMIEQAILASILGKVAK